jgi:hypothetical protein
MRGSKHLKAVILVLTFSTTGVACCPLRAVTVRLMPILEPETLLGPPKVVEAAAAAAAAATDAACTSLSRTGQVVPVWLFRVTAGGA